MSKFTLPRYLSSTQSFVISISDHKKLLEIKPRRSRFYCLSLTPFFKEQTYRCYALRCAGNKTSHDSSTNPTEHGSDCRQTTSLCPSCSSYGGCRIALDTVGNHRPNSYSSIGHSPELWLFFISLFFSIYSKLH